MFFFGVVYFIYPPPPNETNLVSLAIVLPHITPFEFEGEANTDDSVQLTCYVSKGDTPLTISWTLNGKKISSHSGISVVPIGERTSLLIISSVQAEHAGVYTCTAANRAGQVVHNATLLVNGICVFEIILHFKLF